MQGEKQGKKEEEKDIKKERKTCCLEFCGGQ